MRAVAELYPRPRGATNRAPVPLCWRRHQRGFGAPGRYIPVVSLLDDQDAWSQLLRPWAATRWFEFDGPRPKGATVKMQRSIRVVGLLVLACTGIFIVTGKKGLGGRGRWLLIAGLAIPVVYLVLDVW